MKKVITILFWFLLIHTFEFNLLFAQSEVVNDTLTAEKTKKVRNLKNTVRFNLTNPLLFGQKSIIFGYERTLGPRQSFSVNIGQTSFPKLINISTVNPNFQLSEGSSEKGMNASVDYRFYQNKVNRYPAPRGVYIGPYYAYNYFERENTWILNTTSFQGDVLSDFRIDIHTLGFELGYQFVFWKRVALDFVLFGPGMANYSLKTSFDTKLSPEDEAELFQEINDFLAEKFPGYDLVIDDKEYKKSGSTNSTTLGFRYMIHLGVTF